MNLDQALVDNGIKVLQTVGFPSAVAIWFMWRSDRKIEENTKAIVDLTIAINKLEAHR